MPARAGARALLNVDTAPLDLHPQVQCPHCSRRFNAQAAERHIPKCVDIKAKPNRLKGGSGQGLGVAGRNKESASGAGGGMGGGMGGRTTGPAAGGRAAGSRGGGLSRR